MTTASELNELSSKMIAASISQHIFEIMIQRNAEKQRSQRKSQGFSLTSTKNLSAPLRDLSTSAFR